MIIYLKRFSLFGSIFRSASLFLRELLVLPSENLAFVQVYINMEAEMDPNVRALFNNACGISSYRTTSTPPLPVQSFELSTICGYPLTMLIHVGRRADT